MADQPNYRDGERIKGQLSCRQAHRTTNSARLLLLIRGAARATGLFWFLFILLFAVGEGINPLLWTCGEGLMSLTLGTAWIGMLLLWRWETAGGSLVVGGMLAFYLLDWAFSGTPPSGWVFPLLPIPGVLALLAGRLKRAPNSR